MKILIEEWLCTRIEELHYEVESRKEIIQSFLVSAGDPTNEMFKEYQNEYRKYFIEYNKAKQEMVAKYELGNNASWSLDFNTRELTVN